MQAHAPPPPEIPAFSNADNEALKAALRREMHALRAGLSPEDRAARALAAQERILTLDAWRAAREVLCYCAVRGEVDTGRLLDDAWARGLRLVLPRCVPDVPGVLELACAACPADLKPGAYNIPEPDPASCPMLDACKADVAILPGLAFDRAGRRLGYGGGYYDRLLAAGPMHPSLRIGLCYAFQLLPDALPADPWDAPVDAIVTETEIVWISR